MITAGVNWDGEFLRVALPKSIGLNVLNWPVDAYLQVVEEFEFEVSGAYIRFLERLLEITSRTGGIGSTGK